MDQGRANVPASPTDNRGFARKPFGEITNFQSPTNCATGRTSETTTPTKDHQDGGGDGEEAVTPLANLKMLMRVASESSRRELFKTEPSQEDDSAFATPIRDSEFALFRHGSCDSGLGLLGQHEQLLGPQKISRKQKSLGLLCDKFVKRFPESVPEGEKCEIHLDDLAKQMGTERRRIYDIVNVLESVQMMTKIGKNLYQWHGKEHRLATLAWLREVAVKLNMIESYYEAKLHCEETENNALMTCFSSPRQMSCGSPASSCLSPFSAYSSTGTSPASSCGGGPSPSPVVERKTSLGVACQKFLMLFLIAPEPNAKVNLEFAAKVIHGLTMAENMMKTRIRRLYDIANILQSLQLIQKVQITENHGAKKPAFEYIGPNVADMVVTKDVLQSLPATRQRHSLLAVGKNLINIPDDDPRAGLTTKLDTATEEPEKPNYEACKPFKKRSVPDTGFGFSREATPDENVIPKNVGSSSKLARTQSAEWLGAVMQPPASPSLQELSDACEVERQRISSNSDAFRMPSPSSSQFRRSLLRNSPINLSMDRRNAHIISPLARSPQLAVKNYRPSPIIPPSPSNCRKLSPSAGIKLSPTTVVRSSPGQQSIIIRSPNGEKYHPKIKYLRVQQALSAGNSGSQGKTVIALVPKSPNAVVGRRILSPRSENIRNSPVNLKLQLNN